jgi:hypothetical protein
LWNSAAGRVKQAQLGRRPVQARAGHAGVGHPPGQGGAPALGAKSSTRAGRPGAPPAIS